MFTIYLLVFEELFIFIAHSLLIIHKLIHNFKFIQYFNKLLSNINMYDNILLFHDIKYMTMYSSYLLKKWVLIL